MLRPVGTKYEKYFKEGQVIRRNNGDGTETVASSQAAMKVFDGLRRAQSHPATARAWAAELIADPCVSYWLKDALAVLLDRDPLDAQNDAELLARVMQRHAAECSSRSGWS